MFVVVNKAAVVTVVATQSMATPGVVSGASPDFPRNAKTHSELSRCSVVPEREYSLSSMQSPRTNSGCMAKE